MKLKYYLRGLGTGVTVTALILGIALSHGKGRMSDEEVKKRALELGMVEEYKSLSEVSESKEEDNRKGEKDGVSENDVLDSQASVSKNDNNHEKKENRQPEEESLDKADKADKTDKTDKTEEGGFGSAIEKETEDTEEGGKVLDREEESTAKTVILEVRGGDGSVTVAKKAQEAGLVSNAAEFDRFLCAGGYDKKICTGKHEIPLGATMEEIAKLLIMKP